MLITAFRRAWARHFSLAPAGKAATAHSKVLLFIAETENSVCGPLLHTAQTSLSTSCSISAQSPACAVPFPSDVPGLRRKLLCPVSVGAVFPRCFAFFFSFSFSVWIISSRCPYWFLCCLNHLLITCFVFPPDPGCETVPATSGCTPGSTVYDGSVLWKRPWPKVRTVD